MHLSPSASGNLAALFATIIWSSLYLFARTMSGSYSPVEMTFWRWLVAFAALVPFTWRATWQWRGEIIRHLPLLCIISVIGLPGFSIFIFLAGKTTSVTNMSLLAATAPITMALLARFVYGERLPGRQVIGLIIAVCGVVVLVTGGDLAHLLSLKLTIGDLWMLLGASCFGVYSILLRKRPAHMPLSVFLTAIMGLAAVGMLPVVIWEWLFVHPIPVPTTGDIIGMLHIGVSTSVIAFFAWNIAVLRIGPVRAGIVYYSLPFFSAVLAVIFIGERLSAPQIVGGCLIIGGILFSALGGVHRAVAAAATQHKSEN